MSGSDTERRGSTPGWVRRLWGYMLRHRRQVVLSVAAAVVGAGCQTLVPLVARQIVDEAVAHRLGPLWPWLVALVGLATVIFGAAHVRRYLGGQVAIHVQYDLRNDMHDHLQAMDLQSLGRMPTGQLVARANSDSTLVQGLLNFVPILGGNLLLMLLSLGVMIALSPLLAVVSMIIAPSLVFVSYRMRRRIFPATWDAQQREGELVSIVDEDLSGVRVVKAFGQERRELERVTASAEALYGSQMRAVRLQARFQPLLESVPSLGQVAILALGGWMALHHRITLGTFLAFSTYVIALMAPARQLAGVLTVGQQARAGLERIFQLLDTTPSIADAPDAVELPRLEGAVGFDDVHFHYGDGPPVLRGVDLEVRPGERLAIVGPSGSGKSTLAMMISRFFDPDRGSVRVDGVDLRQATLASLRRQVGIVFEDSFLFSDTVRANIAYGRPGASDEEIVAAARAAQAHEFVEELPRGYDTTIGERGLTLSGGQRQRLALARAILADPRVLVLDDATSAIDARTEERVHDALRDVLRGRTTILVAHRRSTLHLADRVVVLDGGRIVAQGTHEELVSTSDLYRSLLSGDDGRDEGHADRVAGHIESLATLTAGGAVTASAWEGGPGGAREASTRGSNGIAEGHQRRATAAAGVRGASIGPGLGGGGGGWRLSLVPTPELLARVEALPPVRDAAAVDLEHESRQDRGFRLATLFGEFRWPLLLGLVFVVVDAIATLAGPLLIKSGIDQGVLAGSGGALLLASAAYLGVTLFDLADQVGETFVTGRTAQRVMLSLRVRIWAQLQRLSLDYYEREMAGRIMTRMTTDVDQFENLMENGLLSALVAMVTFVGVGVALVVISPVLGLCTLSVVLPLAAATVGFRRRAAVLYDQARERIAVVNADFQESLSGVRESQTFAHEAATRARFHRLGGDYVDTRVRAQRLVATYFPFIQFLAGIADAIVLGVGAAMVTSGHLTAGALIAFVLYVDMFFSPIQSLSQVFDSWQQTRVSVGRISELMQLDTATPEPPWAAGVARLEGDLALDGVRFSYPGAPVRPATGAPPPARGPRDPVPVLSPEALTATRPPEALRGVDLGIAPGETVALVGETGAGKSTVMKLLARFYDPESGRVLADGQDLRQLELVGYRRQLGYVPQEAFLFSGSVRDNIAYGRPDADDADVEAAARAVGAHELIAQLPGGYHHQLPERGRSLSAGQRQLIALARAQLVDPAVLLLDEATSNLDLPTEARVATAIRAVSTGRTTVVIAHRLQTARSADRIVVLHRGEVAETGTHDELLALGGRYAAMWEAFELVGGGAGAHRD